MVVLEQTAAEASKPKSLAKLSHRLWKDRVTATVVDGQTCRLKCGIDPFIEVCQWLMDDLGFVFATLVVEEKPGAVWSLLYIFYKDENPVWAYVEIELARDAATVPSLSTLSHGPSLDWHEREAEDLFGLTFAGHPRLGEFVLHEDWPEGINPMRRSFDARRLEGRELDVTWEPPTIVVAPGAFAMPIGPVFADFAESAHFLLETVGEDVIRTIPRFFYKYRGVEKIAEGKSVDEVLLLAERFSGTSAFNHGLAFCQAVEAICGIQVPPRALALRTIFAELERLRHHAAVITGICNSTALAVATAQAALIEEDLLRISCEVGRHRYLFGLVTPGGFTRDIPDDRRAGFADLVGRAERKLHDLHQMLRYSSSFLDRLEEVGIVRTEQAIAYGLVGPVARASGVAYDIRKLFPYADYRSAHFVVPTDSEGDGYARLRVLFHEAEESAALVRHFLSSLPNGPIRSDRATCAEGAALSAVEAPAGAAFHWVRLNKDGAVGRYHVTPPSFTNWHGFHLAAENFAFQDFPIILASFGLSNAECDR
jgi:Ni,Fe-hydrogenase III large subunit/Ni,Fe-hydrogenase III component G